MHFFSYFFIIYFKIIYIFLIFYPGMCEMVIVQDEGNFFQVKPRKRLGMFHPDEG